MNLPSTVDAALGSSRWNPVYGIPTMSVSHTHPSDAGEEEECFPELVPLQPEGLGACEPTSCATRLQQAGSTVQDGVASSPSHTAYLLAIVEKFRLSAETLHAMKNGPEPLCLKAASRCATRRKSEVSKMNKKLK